MSNDSRPDQPEPGSLAFMFVALVLVFAAIGYGLDRWVHTRPWLMVAGVFVGAGIGFVYMVYILFSSSPGRRRKKPGASSGPDRDQDEHRDEEPTGDRGSRR